MKSDIVRAWKDAWRHQSLTSEQQAMPSENSIGTCELTDSDLEAVQGGSPVDGILDNLSSMRNLNSANGLLDSNALTRPFAG